MNHPLTEEKKVTVISGVTYQTCPDFNVNGNCSIYGGSNWPSLCKDFNCEKSDQENREIELAQILCGVRSSS